MSKLIVSFSGPLNEEIDFPPLDRTMRGTWDSHAVAMRDKATPMKRLSTISLIPGMQIALNLDENEDGTWDAMVFDGLGTKENNHIAEQVKEIHTEHKSQLGMDFKPEEPTTFKLDEDGMKNWMYWLRRIADMGFLKVDPKSSAKIPDMKDIVALPGSIIRDPHNSGSKDDRLAKYEFVHVVDTATVGA